MANDIRTYFMIERLLWTHPSLPDRIEDTIRALIFEESLSVEDAIRKLNVVSEEELQEIITVVNEEMEKEGSVSSDIPESVDALPKIRERDRIILEELTNLDDDIDINLIRDTITKFNIGIEEALQRHLEDVMTPLEIQNLITKVDLYPIPSERVIRVLEDLQPFDPSVHGEIIGEIRRDVMISHISLEDAVRGRANKLGLTPEQALSFVTKVDEELQREHREDGRDYGGDLSNEESVDEFREKFEKGMKRINEILNEFNLTASPIFDKKTKNILTVFFIQYLSENDIRTLIQNLSLGGNLKDELTTSYGIDPIDVDEILNENESGEMYFENEPIEQERSTLLSGVGTQRNRSQNVRRRLFAVEDGDTHFDNDDMDIEYNDDDYDNLPQQPLLIPEQLFPSQTPFGTCYVLNFPTLESFMVYDMSSLEEEPWERFLENSETNVIFITFNNHLRKYKGWGIDSVLFHDPMSLPQLTTECKVNTPGHSLTVLPEDVHWDKWYTKFGIENTSGVLASKILAIPEYVNRNLRIFFLSWPKIIRIPASVSGVTMEVRDGFHVNLYGEEIDQSSQEHCAGVSPTKVYDEILIPDLTTLGEDVPWLEKKRILSSEVLPSICGL